jgi:hypothetical protein
VARRGRSPPSLVLQLHKNDMSMRNMGRSALVTRGEGNDSHRWRAVGGHTMRRGGRRKRTPVTRPRTKEARGHEEELCTRNRRMAARRNGYPVVSGR